MENEEKLCRSFIDIVKNGDISELHGLLDSQASMYALRDFYHSTREILCLSEENKEKIHNILYNVR